MESLDLSKTSSKMSTGADNQDGSSISELKEQIKIKKKCLDNANGLIHYYKEKIKECVTTEDELNTVLEKIEEKKEMEDKKNKIKEQIRIQRELRIKKQEENDKLKKELAEAKKKLKEAKETYGNLRSYDDFYDGEETSAGSSKYFD